MYVNDKLHKPLTKVVKNIAKNMIFNEIASNEHGDYIYTQKKQPVISTAIM